MLNHMKHKYRRFIQVINEVALAMDYSPTEDLYLRVRELEKQVNEIKTRQT